MPYIKERHRIYMQRYRAKHPDRDRTKERAGRKRSYYKETDKSRRYKCEWQKRRCQELRAQLIQAYGGCCTCCGEKEPVFLTLEHLQGGGAEHRKKYTGNGWRLYLAIKREGYPDKYTILCMNCNFAKRFGRTCPHQITHGVI